ncbi:hypothetical protein H4Q26_005906 [Puccinia striiformis f. sp. tritici PST-130]|nr:hypothetical protein H4Q26_005906 [Puccinia striiformis f. sp. tritici PST-130]
MEFSRWGGSYLRTWSATILKCHVIEAMDWTYSGYEELARTGNVKNIQEYLSEQVIKCGISVNTFGINDYLLGFLPESFPEDNVEASRNAIKESNRVLMSMDNHILKLGRL